MTLSPVEAMEPIAIAWPWSARMEFRRPRLDWTKRARWSIEALPVALAVKPGSEALTSPRRGEGYLGAAPGGR